MKNMKKLNKKWWSDIGNPFSLTGNISITTQNNMRGFTIGSIESIDLTLSLQMAVVVKGTGISVMIPNSIKDREGMMNGLNEYLVKGYKNQLEKLTLI